MPAKIHQRRPLFFGVGIFDLEPALTDRLVQIDPISGWRPEIGKKGRKMDFGPRKLGEKLSRNGKIATLSAIFLPFRAAGLKWGL